MNNSSAFGRKLIYLVVLLGMLIPLYLLGQPSGGSGDPGGRLSEMRVSYNIAESDLGEISPASETMKLASLGLRGVAATLLWNKAHKYRVMHEWDRLKATLNNIALLQPHYDKVWEHQAHNLAYNVSVEFDDYRQRYEMVREGTEFLTRGVRQNRNAPRLIWYTGWFYGQKMGMSDEKRQFRRLFADDEVLHEALMKENIAVDSPEALGPLQKPDNWLVGRLWCRKGYDLVEEGVEIRRQTPLNFYETGPKWRMKHAEAIEKEGILDDRAQVAWQNAYDDWIDFGNRSIPTLQPFTIKLDRIEELGKEAERKLEQFKEECGEAYTIAEQKKIDALPVDYKKIYEKPPEERTEAGKRAMKFIAQSILPDLEAVAKEVKEPARKLRAVELISEMEDVQARFNKTRGYREQINYPYWKTLAQAEQEKRTVDARRLLYEAEQFNAEAELEKAIAKYIEAFEQWAEIFDDYPILTIDDSAEDLFSSIRHYMVAIDSQDLPEDFPLYEFARMMRDNGNVDADLYEQYRKTQKEKTAARKKELEEEERRREEAAAAEKETKPEMKETEDPKSAETPDSKVAETKDDEEKADEKAEMKKESAEPSDDSKEGKSAKEKTDGEPDDAGAKSDPKEMKKEPAKVSAEENTEDAKKDKPKETEEV